LILMRQCLLKKEAKVLLKKQPEGLVARKKKRQEKIQLQKMQQNNFSDILIKAGIFRPFLFLL
jgi:hypothetical protein